MTREQWEKMLWLPDGMGMRKIYPSQNIQVVDESKLEKQEETAKVSNDPALTAQSP